MQYLLSIQAIGLREYPHIAPYGHINEVAILECLFQITTWVNLAEELQVNLLQVCKGFRWVKKVETGPLHLRTVSASEIRVDLIILIRYGTQTIFLS